jgi:hypothetical protein
MDDLPLLITPMQDRNLAALLDHHINVHGRRIGVSGGDLCMVWLAPMLSNEKHGTSGARL